ncbi:MAG: Bug family tripartite tricarboxylate transporter substrate binding protein [Hylemonella sp.]
MPQAPIRSLFAALVATACLLSGASAWAQAGADWPKAKPVNIVVGFGPGAFTDVIARVVAQKLGEITGGNFVVENKPGAGGNIATGQVKRAAPDGYTILVHSVAYSVNPSLYPNAGYDPIKDFVPLALGPRTPNILTVHPNTPAKDLKELVELARTQKLTYASSGIGTTTHLSMERLKAAAKVDIVHVPYQPAQAVGAVVAGHTSMSSTSMPPAVPQIKAGKLRAIAVTSAKRNPLLPEVPSITEFGYKDFDDYTWVGLFVPAGTPPALVERINAEINKAMELPESKEKFVSLGMESSRNTSAQFGAFLRDEVSKWAEVVKSTGAKVE